MADEVTESEFAEYQGDVWHCGHTGWTTHIDILHKSLEGT